MAPFQLQLPKNRELNGGDVLAQSLKHLGTEVAFGLHGGHLDAFLLAAHESGIKLIDTRHEQVTVQAAEGYAKISGKVGVCFVTANSGFSNGLPGLATAFADRSPIFCITSSPPLQDSDTNALQGFHDQVLVSKPITKWAHRITKVEEIPRIVAYAFRSANVGIKGPVLLDFPIDVLFSPPQQHRITWGAIDVSPAAPPGPDLASIDQSLVAWRSAKRPVIITGTGVRVRNRSNSHEASGVYQHSGFLFQQIQRTATALAALAGDEPADFVLLLAARTGFLLGGRSGAIIPNDVTIAQVDLDGSEIGRSHAVNIGITSDAKLFCEAVVAKVSSDPLDRRDSWIETCRALTRSPLPYETDGKVQEDGQLHPFHAMSAVMKALPPDSIIMVDGGEAGQWACMTLEQAKPHVAIVATGYLGFLGNGWGYSIGAAVANPSRLVVNIHGDGSAGFHIQELDTIARHNLNILTVVVNNYVWGMSINGQDLLYEGKTNIRPAVRLSKACAYEVVAQGLNCQGAKVTEYDDVAPTVENFSEVGPALVNLIVSVKPTTPATLSMVGATGDPNVIVVPYYDNLPRPFYKNTKGENEQQF